MHQDKEGSPSVSSEAKPGEISEPGLQSGSLRLTSRDRLEARETDDLDTSDLTATEVLVCGSHDLWFSDLHFAGAFS